MRRDSLGRRRAVGQERGLKPIHPKLPRQWRSRSLRVAMSTTDWERFAELVDAIAPDAETRARAVGIALSTLLETAPRRTIKINPGPLAWMDWEQQKIQKLLGVAESA